MGYQVVYEDGWLWFRDDPAVWHMQFATFTDAVSAIIRYRKEACRHTINAFGIKEPSGEIVWLEEGETRRDQNEHN